jgi:CBS-domain-containing membrane protein
LPVIDKDNKLVGVVTEHDFIKLATHVLENDLEAYQEKTKKNRKQKSTENDKPSKDQL